MTCPLCGRRTDDAPAHPVCVSGLDSRLQRIPVLYAELAVALEPGSSAAARVSGTRTPPLPLRLEPLSLQCRGGIVSMLGTWESDWRSRRGLAPDHYTDREHLLAGRTQLRHVIFFLRTHLGWAVRHHPAVDEFATEVADIIAACRVTLGDVLGHMKIGRCPAQLDGRTCGRVLYADPYADDIQCDRCHTRWHQSQWLLLGAVLAESGTA
jgi:hypothetical protein